MEKSLPEDAIKNAEETARINVKEKVFNPNNNKFEDELHQSYVDGFVFGYNYRNQEIEHLNKKIEMLESNISALLKVSYK